MTYTPCAVLNTADNLHTESGVSALSEVPPFIDIFKALAFYNHNNPARMKSVNLLERDNGTIHQEGSVELWSILCVMIWRALKQVEGTLGYDAFRYWYMTPRENKVVAKASKEDLAEHLGVGIRTLNRHLNKTLDRVERELRDACLIPQPFISV